MRWAPCGGFGSRQSSVSPPLLRTTVQLVQRFNVRNLDVWSSFLVGQEFDLEWPACKYPPRASENRWRMHCMSGRRKHERFGEEAEKKRDKTGEEENWKTLNKVISFGAIGSVLKRNIYLFFERKRST